MQNQANEDGAPVRFQNYSGAASARGWGRMSIAVLVAATVMLGAGAGWFLSPREEPDVYRVQMVPQEEMVAAIETLNVGVIAAPRADPRECKWPMGFATVSTPGNPAGGNVVFRTSKYKSPPFHVTDKPQRIAFPHPLPETGGVDLFTAEGNAKGLIVSLFPTTRMEPVNGTSTVKVRWLPRPRCKS
jgi:hypothetical protein